MKNIQIMSIQHDDYAEAIWKKLTLFKRHYPPLFSQSTGIGLSQKFT